jgi:hypothetical protein
MDNPPSPARLISNRMHFLRRVTTSLSSSLHITRACLCEKKVYISNGRQSIGDHRIRVTERPPLFVYLANLGEKDRETRPVGICSIHLFFFSNRSSTPPLINPPCTASGPVFFCFFLPFSFLFTPTRSCAQPRTAVTTTREDCHHSISRINSLLPLPVQAIPHPSIKRVTFSCSPKEAPPSSQVPIPCRQNPHDPV